MDFSTSFECGIAFFPMAEPNLGDGFMALPAFLKPRLKGQLREHNYHKSQNGNCD